MGGTTVWCSYAGVINLEPPLLVHVLDETDDWHSRAPFATHGAPPCSELRDREAQPADPNIQHQHKREQHQ